LISDRKCGRAEIDVIDPALVTRTGVETTLLVCPPAAAHRGSAASDAGLLAAPDGNPGLRVLYERHFDDLFRYVAARIGGQAAEDVVAETFVIAFARRAAFDPSRVCALPWLVGIATNLLRSRRRAERRHLAIDPGRLERGGAPDSGLEDSVARADAASLRSVVMRAVGRLRPSERDAFLVHALVGLEGSELAAALGVSPSAASVRLHRARTRLRATLPPALFSQEEDRE
jgi:RNA polymerase sigma factor (sigma-70 family)